MKNVSFMGDFLTPSNLRALNLGQPPYYYLPPARRAGDYKTHSMRVCVCYGVL